MEKTENEPKPGNRLSLTALRVDELAAVLSRAGGRPVTAEMIQRQIAAGAPLNPDGTVNLIQFTAWLAREVARGD
jgi:hypothetical protein